MFYHVQKHKYTMPKSVQITAEVKGEAYKLLHLS